MALAEVVVETEEQVDSLCSRLRKTLDVRKRPLKVRISLDGSDRSDLQNRALFGVAYPALEEVTGYTKDELHESMCIRYFGSKEIELFGMVVVRPLRTTTRDEDGKLDIVNSADFAAFYEFIRDFAAMELDVTVPAPDPNLRKVK